MRLRNNEWTTMSPLLSNRNNHKAIVFNKYIYLYGGDTETSPECYDISSNTWSSNNANVFNGIRSNNCVYDDTNRLFYMYESKKIYSISIVDTIKTMVYEDVSDCVMALLLI